MQLSTVPLSSLLPPKDNPRRTFDHALIAGLAQSIKIDGLLQNLLVRPEGDGTYRVIFGKRRYLALQHLKKQGAIDGDYPVPVDIKDDLGDGDAVRLATVENVQREPLHPMDEAEAFAKQLQAGGTVEDIIEKTGLSAQTVKRRLALATLCPDAKKALRSGAISRSVAEAMTVGSREQQRAILEGLDAEYPPDPEEIREMLIEGKPSLAMAIFEREHYTGTLTTDLFAEDETTYFDDVDQFLTRQREAVDALAEHHRRTAASIREGLARHEVKETVALATRQTPLAPRPARQRPEFAAELLRYIACQKSAAVQAALLGNPRKAKEVAVLLLLLGFRINIGARLDLHPCHAVPMEDREQRSYRSIDAAAAELADRLGLNSNDGYGSGREHAVGRLIASCGALSLYEALGHLSDDELDRLAVILPILCFGQEELLVLDTGESLFNRIAVDLGTGMRQWWVPDTNFLSGLLREQVVAVVTECGAANHLSGFNGWTKKQLVDELVRYFADRSDPEKLGADDDRTAAEWLPGILRFPATKTVATEPSPA